MPHAADPHQPSSFGRGWIPASRDIGLPDDALPAVGAKGRGRVPLPQAGGVRGGHSPIGERGRGGHSPVGERGFYTEEGRAHPRPLPQAGGEKPRDSLPPAGGEAPGSLLHPNQFTPTRIALFLEHLSRHGQVRAAAQVAGVSQQTAYVRRRRDAGFAAGWAAALILAREAAEQVLAERALHGTTETIWFRGEAVGERQRFDARLLLAHLARLDARAAQAPQAVHHLAEDFDRMLLALAEGADVAAATGWTDPARDRFLKAFEARADADYKQANPLPDDDAPDEVWDDWQAELNDHLEAARRAAPEAWDHAQSRREAAFHTLFSDDEDEEGEEQAGARHAGYPRSGPECPVNADAEAGQAAARTASEPCKLRKPLSVLKCGTSPSALLSAGLSWPLRQSPQALRPLPATPVPLPPAPAPLCSAAVTARPS